MDTFTDRLQALHERVLNPETGKPWTQRAVVAGLAEGGVNVSVTYLSQLLNGHRGRPSFEIVQGLAAFYGVSLNYFDLNDPQAATSVLQQLDTLELVRNRRFRQILTRAHGDDRQEVLAALLDAIDIAERQDRDLPEASDQGNPSPR